MIKNIFLFIRYFFIFLFTCLFLGTIINIYIMNPEYSLGNDYTYNNDLNGYETIRKKNPDMRLQEVFLSIFTDYNYSKGNIAHTAVSKVLISNIIDYQYDDNYIIIASVKRSDYICDEFNVANPWVIDAMDYTIIDKVKHQYFSTVNKKSFLNMKQKLNITLFLKIDKEKMQKYTSIVEDYNIENAVKDGYCTPIKATKTNNLDFYRY